MTDFPDWTLPAVPGAFTLAATGALILAVTNTREVVRATIGRMQQATIHARKANTATVYLGTVAVTRDESATTGGLQLYPGDWLLFPVLDIASVYLIGTAGDGVTYALWS